MPRTVTTRRTDDPELLRGTLLIKRRRCGKPNCRCVHDEPHETPVLSYSEGGRTKTVALRPEDVPAVEAALARYDAARAELEAQALAGIRTLVAGLAARRGQGSRR
jgi:hypothetical protein